jgi:beta-N-acetylhexosaminidase
VNRLRDALAPLPSAQAVGAVVKASGKTAFAREHGELIARAIRAFGFNTTLAPVVDLALPESTEVLGSRPPGSTASDVIDYARSFLEGLAANGVAGCGKHFPGLGGAGGDTHFVTPEIPRTSEQIWNEDLVPYRELHREMPMIMMNHAAYPQTQSKNHPASASAFWITSVLRKKIGYRGVILSDDLEMGGILKFMPVDEAAVEAVRAGSDLLEICHSAELILRSYEALITEAEKSAAFRTLLLARAREVGKKQARLYKSGVSKALTAKQLLALKDRILKFGERIAAHAKDDVIAPRAISPAETS